VLDLESYIEDKDGNSFGERELTDLLRKLRVKHRLPAEGLAEKALRLYGSELAEALRNRPPTRPPEGTRDMDTSAHPIEEARSSPEGASSARAGYAVTR
jgi:hypothetical protein